MTTNHRNGNGRQKTPRRGASASGNIGESLWRDFAEGICGCQANGGLRTLEACNEKRYRRVIAEFVVYCLDLDRPCLSSTEGLQGVRESAGLGTKLLESGFYRAVEVAGWVRHAGEDGWYCWFSVRPEAGDCVEEVKTGNPVGGVGEQVYHS